jgi:hypothetical protein
MSEQTDPSPVDQSPEALRVNPPYEAALNTAVKNLTDQILIFLLAYTILLIGVAVFGSGLAIELRTLLYIIPILGVVAYVWLKRGGAEKESRRDVRVRSSFATGQSYVGGKRGATHEGSGSTDVSSLFASGGSTVIGRDAGRQTGRSTETPLALNTQYLLDIFQQLDRSSQRKLIESAHSLLEQQRSHNA